MNALRALALQAWTESASRIPEICVSPHMLASECVGLLIEVIVPAQWVFDDCIPVVILFTVSVFEGVEDLKVICKDMLGCESEWRPQKYFLSCLLVQF